MRWPMYPLGQLCDVIIGATPARKEPAYWGGDNVWVTVSELNDNTICDSKEHITDLGIQNSASKLIPKGTLLFSFKLSIGKMAFAGVDLYTNEAIAALPIRRGVPLDNRFLYYAVRQFDSSLGAHIAVKGKLLNKRKIKRIPIPLPPLSEQRRIVEILDQADALRKKRAEADAKAARILFALFIKSFGNPLTNPMGWQEVTLGSRCDIVTGNTPSTKKAEYYGKDILWARPADLDNQILVTRTEKMLSAAGGKVGRIVPHNSVLVVCIGATLGKVALAGTKMAINQQINAALPSDSLLPEFLYVQCALLADRFCAAATKSTLPILNKSRFSNQKVLCPPKDKQKAFVRTARIVISSHDARAASRELLESLFQSLLHLAFKGDLTAQWRQAHMKELLEEMEQQAKALETPISEDGPATIRIKRNKRRAKG